MSASAIPSAWPTPASNPRSAASETPRPALGPAKPDPGGNALAETINGLCKAELIRRRRPWRSFEAVEFATLTWVDWFNKRRLLEPIGNIPPAEAEERYDAMQDEPDMAA
jgi:transposase InsO family protein